MGFNISVLGVLNPENEECSKYIDRNYYNFTTSYDIYEEGSVLIKSGEYFDLDLKFLGIHFYNENDFETEEEFVAYREARKINIAEVLPIVTIFRDCVSENPNFLENVVFESKENINQKDYFLEYTSSKKIIDDLNHVIRSLECHLKNGESQIWFEAA